jgi:hypothetical protein
MAKHVEGFSTGLGTLSNLRRIQLAPYADRNFTPVIPSMGSSGGARTNV